MIYLIKKELKDLFLNYKSWIIFIISVCLPFVLDYRGMTESSWIYISIVTMALCQYIYDSFLNDTKNKGIIFVYNMRRTSYEILISKIIIAICFLSIIFLFTLKYVIEYISFMDLLWIIGVTLTGVAFMQFIAIFSQSAETTSAIFSTIFIFAYTFFLWDLDLAILKIGISLASAILMSFIAIKTADSLVYRQQL